MNQRTERLGAEIQSVLGRIISRGEIRDARVRDAGLVTITSVRVTGDLREARVAFAVFGADDAALERVRQGLQSARSYLQHELGRQLRARNTALLSFVVDRGLDNAFRVDSLLRQEAAASAATAGPGAAESASEPGPSGASPPADEPEAGADADDSSGK
jgi:ribosome-binding factor A